MNKKVIIFSVSTLLLAAPLAVFATDPGAWINGIATNILNMIVWPIFGGSIVIMLVFSGFLFVTANGDPGKVTTAKKAFLWTLVGIIVGITAFSAAGIIGGIIGSGGGDNGGCADPSCET